MSVSYRFIEDATGKSLAFSTREACGRTFRDVAYVAEIDSANPILVFPVAAHALGLNAVRKILEAVDTYKKTGEVSGCIP